MQPWRKIVNNLIVEKKVKPCCVYNADQTGLFFQKLPNSLYVHKDNKKKYTGTKKMKDKARITLMVCTAADGSKLPLALVGKPKKPRCFNLLSNPSSPPIAYTSQRNAWFDRKVTTWWIRNVFWKQHKLKHGDVNCILLLDNCSGHDIDMSNFSSH